MKRILGRVTILAALVLALALGTNALAGAFTAGDIVIYRVGDGTQPLTNNGNYVFLDEYTVTNTLYDGTPGNGSQTFDMTWRQTIAMPTGWYGANAPVASDAFADAEGELTTSADGRFIVLTGYGATLTSGASPTYQLTNTSVGGSSATALVARIVGLVDGYGHIDTTTAQTNLNEQGNSIRAATSLNGTNIWMTGSSDQTTYAVRAGGGSGLSTQVCTSAQLQTPYRMVNIFQNTLFIDRQTAMAGATNVDVSKNLNGGALPTSFIVSNFDILDGVEQGTQSAFPNHTVGNSAYGFMMFNIGNAHSGGALPDTLYIADNNQDYYGEPITHGGGVLKYCWISGAWSNVGVIGAVGAHGITGVKNGGSVTLYITSGGTVTPLNTLYAYYDTSGYPGVPEDNTGGNGARGIQLTSYPTILNSHGVANVLLMNTRGVTMAPQGGEYATQSGAWVTNAIKADLTVGPPYGANASGNAGGPYYMTNVYSCANFGTNTLSVSLSGGPPSWLTGTFSPSSTISPLGSVTYTVTVNSQANTLGANSSGSWTLGTGPGGQSHAISFNLIVNSFALSPLSNCLAVGEQCGTFTFQPAGSNVYTLTNVTSGALQWGAIVSNSSPWVTLSSTGTLLAGHTSIDITALVTSAASTNPVGTYQDLILFSNFGISPPAQMAYEAVRLQVGFGFFDDFSTYAPGNVVGQHEWTASAAATDNPVQIKTFNGILQYVVPGGDAGANTSQQPRKNFTGQAITNALQAGGQPVYGYFAMLLVVTNGSASQNYVFDIAAGLNGGNFYQANSGMLSNSPTTYKWTLQLNQPNSQATVSGTPRNFGTQYQVYIVGDEVNSNAWIFVNPALSDLANPTGASDWDVYVNWNNISCSSCGGATTNLGSVVMGQYGDQPGYVVALAAASTNATTVYNFLNGLGGSAPVVANFTVDNSSGQAPLTVNFTDTSTGTPPPTSWFWTFDGVNTSTSESPSFTYSSPGGYTAQLIASNGCNWSTNTMAITVTSAQTPFAAWQTFYFSGGTLNGNAAPGADPYGSGMSNTNKYLAGFGTNKMASLHIISVAKANSTNVVVTFLGANGDSSYSPGVVSRTNRLEFTTGTANGNYATNNFAQVPGVADVVLSGGAGTGFVTSVTDVGGAVSSSTSRYYRVRVLLP